MYCTNSDGVRPRSSGLKTSFEHPSHWAASGRETKRSREFLHRREPEKWRQMKVDCIYWQDEQERWHKQMTWGRE
jgi:hypothetical protein